MTTRTYPIWHPYSQARFSEKPLKVVSAKDALITLEDGREVLDMTCSWWVTLHGHAHPLIAQAIYQQALQCEHVLFANFTHDPALKLCNKLLSHLPHNLNHVFFSDNGSTSVEVAMKIAFQYWRNIGRPHRRRFLSFEGAYHGDTLGAMSLSAPSIFNEPFAPLLIDVDFVPYPAIFDEDPGIASKERDAIEKLCLQLEEHKDEYAALMIEPLVQGAGGMRMCRPQFLGAVQEIAKKEGLLVIYDEVFVGFGRTGEWFACTKAKTTPDLLCLAKGITGGFLPLSVTICTDSIFEAFQDKDPMKSFFHGHSYSANPLGCAASIASLQLLEENPHAFQRLEILHRLLSAPLKDHPRVEKLRFCGTIAAFDVVSEKTNYLNPIGVPLRTYCLEHGVFIRPLGNVVYILPPYCTTEEQLAHVYKVLKEALDRL